MVSLNVSYRDLDIQVTVKDSQGRIFDSIDTLPVDWKLSDNSLAALAQPKGVLSKVGVHIFPLVYLDGRVADPVGAGSGPFSLDPDPTLAT